MTDTIAALATGAGRAGVAIIRVSGPGARGALAALAPAASFAARRVRLARFTHPMSGAALDTGYGLYLPAPATFTGEDIAEFHVHGGPATIAAALDALFALPGMRLAEPGEFARRAFAHGKLDLTQAEALADLIDAESEGQRAQALAQYEGALGERIARWRARLIAAMALLEAEIDFPDEDTPASARDAVRPLITALAAELSGFLDDLQRGERVREGYRIALIGAPNTGKSSLLNALVQREAAIVSDIPGTTRDVIEARLVLGGFPVWIADTAGLRAAGDAIEAEGVKRALARARDADLRIGVLDCTDIAASRAALDGQMRAGDLIVLSKLDRIGAMQTDASWDHAVSAHTGEGMAALLGALTARVVAALGGREAAPITRARHRALVQDAHGALGRAESALDAGAELAAEELRLAARALGRLVGAVDVEDLLDAIFAQFCIGK